MGDHERRAEGRRHAGYARAKKHGLTVEQLTELQIRLGTACNICGASQGSSRHGLALDHSHTTNMVRGFLCGNCNFGIGKFNDDVELMAKAVAYLINPPATEILGQRAA
jgi:hypothetical protein